jgi:hypothetical protein
VLQYCYKGVLKKPSGAGFGLYLNLLGEPKKKALNPQAIQFI